MKNLYLHREGKNIRDERENFCYILEEGLVGSDRTSFSVFESNNNT